MGAQETTDVTTGEVFIGHQNMEDKAAFVPDGNNGLQRPLKVSFLSCVLLLLC